MSDNDDIKNSEEFLVFPEDKKPMQGSEAGLHRCVVETKCVGCGRKVPPSDSFDFYCCGTCYLKIKNSGTFVKFWRRAMDRVADHLAENGVKYGMVLFLVSGLLMFFQAVSPADVWRWWVGVHVPLGIWIALGIFGYLAGVAWTLYVLGRYGNEVDDSVPLSLSWPVSAPIMGAVVLFSKVYDAGYRKYKEKNNV